MEFHTFGYNTNPAVVFIYEGLGHGAFEEAHDFYDRLYEFCEKK